MTREEINVLLGCQAKVFRTSAASALIGSAAVWAGTVFRSCRNCRQLGILYDHLQHFISFFLRSPQLQVSWLVMVLI